MPDQNLTANVAIKIKARISVNGNVWKDKAILTQNFGREVELRTVQGGDIDAIPGAKTGSGQLETAFDTGMVESVWPPVDPNSVAFWIYNIFELGVFPILTIEKLSEDRSSVQATLNYTAWATDIQPNATTEGTDHETFILTLTPKTLVEFKK